MLIRGTDLACHLTGAEPQHQRNFIAIFTLSCLWPSGGISDLRVWIYRAQPHHNEKVYSLVSLTFPDVVMAIDSLSPIAPARIRALLLPMGRIKRSSFMNFVDLLQPECMIRLGDISPDPRPNRSMIFPAVIFCPSSSLRLRWSPHDPYRHVLSASLSWWHSSLWAFNFFASAFSACIVTFWAI